MSANLVLESLLKGGVILAAAWGTTRLMRGASAATRHWIWVVAIAALLAVPVLSGLDPVWRVAIPQPVSVGSPPPPSRPGPAPVADGLVGRSAGRERPRVEASVLPMAPNLANGREEAERTSSAVAETEAAGRRPMTWSRLALGLWGMGMGLGLLRLALGLNAGWRHARGARRIEDMEWLITLAQAKTALGLDRRVSLRRSAETTVPVVSGIFSPTVLLPESSDQWSADRRRVVLLHELAHVQRRDCLLQALTRLAQAAHWCNPLAHLAARRILVEQERACDDRVLDTGTNRQDYATHLLEIVQAFRATPRPRRWYDPWPEPAMARPNLLEGRMMAILASDQRRHAPSLGIKIWLAVAVMAGAGAVATVGVAPTEARSADAIQATTDRPAASGGQATGASQPTERSPAASGTAGQTAAPASGEADQVDEADDTEDVVPRVRDPRRPARSGVVIAPETTVVQAVPQAAPRVTAVPWTHERTTEWNGVVAPHIVTTTDGNGVISRHIVTTTDGIVHVALGQDGTAGGDADDPATEEARRRAAEALASALNDDSERVRRTAAQALAAMRDERAVPALVMALESEDENVRRMAVDSLARFDTPEARQALRLALADSSVQVRRRAVIQIQTARNPDDVAPLRTLLRDEDPTVRRLVVNALGNIGDGAAVDALSEALEDEDPEVRDRAVAALGRIARGDRFFLFDGGNFTIGGNERFYRLNQFSRDVSQLSRGDLPELEARIQALRREMEAVMASQQRLGAEAGSRENERAQAEADARERALQNSLRDAERALQRERERTGGGEGEVREVTPQPARRF